MAQSPTSALLDPTGGVEDPSAGGVLMALAASRAREKAEAAHQLVLACAWADQHPVWEPGEEATLTTAGPDGGVHLPLSGPGAPQITEHSVAEFGVVLGESTDAAKRLIGHALELRHRLPRLWALVLEGRIPAWRARLIAAETISRGLTPEAADWVDRQVAAVAGKLGSAAIMRVVHEAAARHGLPERVVADPQRLRVDLDGDGSTGTVLMSATLTTVDGLDLDHALAHEAATLKALGSQDNLDTRRAQALGHLARQQTALALFGDEHPDTAQPDDDANLPEAREMVLHLHFNAALDPTHGEDLKVDRLGRLEKGQRLIFLDHVQAWCADSHTRVSIRPVIDLTTERTAPGYSIPDRIRDHVVTRDRTCMFPWCTRPARRCDLDHVTPFDHDAAAEHRPQPGPTSTTNLISLCRRHHRLKTFTGWQVTMPTPGTVTWTSPHGHHFQRDPSGTTRLPPDKPPPD